VQWALLALFVGLPFSGLFRIDAAAGRFLVGGYQIWWDDFFIVFPFWAMLFFSMTAFYSNFGMVFCGWMCPQHTLSEWLNDLVRRLLGRRVLAGVSPERRPGRSKRKRLTLVAAWAGFVAVVLLASAVMTLAVLHYFFPWDVLWGHFTGGRYNLYVAVFAILIGTFTVVDLGLLRHFWCKYMCPYGLWQYMFRNRDTLQIRFDQARADDCRRCTLCKDVCPMDLDPRQPEIYTRCINCGICIDACESYMARFDKPKILSFGFGTRREALVRIETGRSRVLTPSVLFPVGAVVASAALFAYGVVTFQPVKLVVHQEPGYALASGDLGVRYTAVIRNKEDHFQALDLAVTGLPDGVAKLARPAVRVPPGAEVEVPFTVRHQGLAYDRPYRFRFTAALPGTGGRFGTDATYYLPDLSEVPDAAAGVPASTPASG
jgi:polyferredoxin